MFSAALVAGLCAVAVLFTWHRRVMLWESAAANQAAAIAHTIDRAERWDSDTFGSEMLAADLELLKSQEATAQAHLRAFAPLRDESVLHGAIRSVGMASRVAKEKLEKRTVEMKAAQAEAERERALEVADWQAVAERHVDGLRKIKAAGGRVDAAIMVANAHLERMPAGANPAALREEIRLARAR